MIGFRLLITAALLAALPLTSFSQTRTKTRIKKKGHTTAVAVIKPAAKPAPVEVSESLSGLDLLPNRHTGEFAVRISHRLTQAATFRLIDTKTSRYLRTELLEASSAPVRALQVGKLPYGEYKMEVLLPDTVYWKTVRVRK